MKQRIAALSEDRVLSRKDKEQIIGTAVCSVFGYSAGLVNWSQTELDGISTCKTWAHVHKTAWGLSRGTDGSPFILDQSAGGRGCPSATKMWAREILDIYEHVSVFLAKSRRWLDNTCDSNAPRMVVTLSPNYNTCFRSVKQPSQY
jgi:hypothetical protein